MQSITMNGLTTTLLLFFTAVANGHSWVEQMMVIGANGTLVGEPGYARGNVLRTAQGFSDPSMVNLIPPDGGSNVITPDMAMCKSTQQTPNQTANSPMLQAAPGAMIALRYQENGHVTLPQNQPGKPANRGTLYVYGTSQPSPNDTLLGIQGQWTADGQGGDKRGVLLSTQNFDDGQCYQINNGNISTARQKEFPHEANTLMGADLWCQQDIALPNNVPVGKAYTLYWVWMWPTLPGTPGFPDGKNETYTTCADVNVVSGSNTTEKVSNPGFVPNQPLDNAAVSAEFAQLLDPTAAAAQPSNSAAPESNSAAAPGAAATSSLASPVPAAPASTITTSALAGLASPVSPAQPSDTESQAPAPTPAAAGGPATVYETIPVTVTVTAAPMGFATKLRRQAVETDVVTTVRVTETETVAPIPMIRGRFYVW